MNSPAIRIALILGVLFVAGQARAGEFSWKASRTIRVPRSTETSRANRMHRSLYVRQIENRVRLAAAEQMFWQRRMADYEVFRFSDAIRPARDAAAIELLAASIRLEELRTELRAVRRQR